MSVGNLPPSWIQRIKETYLYLTDNTTWNVTTGRHGFAPKLSGSASEYLRGDGAWGSVSASNITRIIQIAVTDPNGDAITTGDGKAYCRVNSVMNGYNLTAVAAHVTTVSSSGLPTIQVYNVTQAADMLTTKITIDANEKDSKDAATAAVIDTGNDDVATGDELRIDIDVAGTGAKGLIVDLTFQAP